jgi:ABC-type transport system substrate-binding protein
MAVIGLFFFSVGGTVQTASGQQTVKTNFELLLMTNAGNRIRESYAFFVKQAVAPLGIDVEILAKPFGQFVGDLLHISTGQPFDLAIIGFSGGGPTPGFKWKFHSVETSFGIDMYQLNNPAWKIQQQNDIGVSTDTVDKLVDDIEFELDPLVRKGLID